VRDTDKALLLGIAVVLSTVVIVVVFWLGVGAIVWHFVQKFW
jgi:hypothetical protein